MSYIYEPVPTDGRKSFYGKCRVIVADDGTETLISYTTPVLRKHPSGEYERLWFDWSQTTGRHIKAWSGMNKAQFTALGKED